MAVDSPLIGGEGGKCSPKVKCCAGCAVCTVILAAVLIPVNIFVVMPKIAQQTLDTTSLNLPNVTMYPCNSADSMNVNHIHTNVPGLPIPGGSTLHSYNTTLSTMGCVNGSDIKIASACANPETIPLGWYISPEMTMMKGDNYKDFTVHMVLHDTTSLLMAFILPMFAEQHKAPLIIEAKKLDITVLGIKITDLHMKNELTCSGTGILPQFEIPDQYCPKTTPAPQESRGRRLDQGSGYYMTCTDGLSKNYTMNVVV